MFKDTKDKTQSVEKFEINEINFKDCMKVWWLNPNNYYNTLRQIFDQYKLR